MTDKIVSIIALTFQIIALCKLHKSRIDLSYETAEVRNYLMWLMIFWFSVGVVSRRWLTGLVKLVIIFVGD